MRSTESEPILVERDGPCAVVRLNRPEKLNALNGAMLQALARAVDDLSSSDVSALLVTGVGDRAFSAGADLVEIAQLSPAELDQRNAFARSTFARISELPFPSLALINGIAFGGGLELAMACTFRLAVPNAVMAMPEVDLGFIPSYGGTQRLPVLVGEARALEWILSCRHVLAPEAERVGFLQGIVEPPAERHAREWLEPFSKPGRSAPLLARAAVTFARICTRFDGFTQEHVLAAQACRTPEAQERLKVFAARGRSPLSDCDPRTHSEHEGRVE